MDKMKIIYNLVKKGKKMKDKIYKQIEKIETCFTSEQHNFIKKRAKEQEVTKNEIVRRAVTLYMKMKMKKICEGCVDSPPHNQKLPCNECSRNPYFDDSYRERYAF